MSIKSFSEYSNFTYILEGMTDQEKEEFGELTHQEFLKQARSKHDKYGKLKKGETLTDQESAALRKEHDRNLAHDQNIKSAKSKIESDGDEADLDEFEEKALEKDKKDKQHAEHVENGKMALSVGGRLSDEEKEAMEKEEEEKGLTPVHKIVGRWSKKEKTSQVAPQKTEETPADSKSSTKSGTDKPSADKPAEVSSDDSADKPESGSNTTRTTGRLKQALQTYETKGKTEKPSEKPSGEASGFSTTPTHTAQAQIDIAKMFADAAERKEARRKKREANNPDKPASATEVEKPVSDTTTETKKPAVKKMSDTTSRIKKILDAEKEKQEASKSADTDKPTSDSEVKKVTAAPKVKKAKDKVATPVDNNSGDGNTGDQLSLDFDKTSKAKKTKAKVTPDKPDAPTEEDKPNTSADQLSLDFDKTSKAKKTKAKVTPVTPVTPDKPDAPTEEDKPETAVKTRVKAKVKRKSASKGGDFSSDLLNAYSKQKKEERAKALAKKPTATPSESPDERKERIKGQAQELSAKIKARGGTSSYLDGIAGEKKPKSASKILKTVTTAAKNKAQEPPKVEAPKQEAPKVEAPEKDDLKGYTNVPVKIKPHITITHTPTAAEKRKKHASQITDVKDAPKSKLQKFGDFVKGAAKKVSKTVKSALQRAKQNIASRNSSDDEAPKPKQEAPKQEAPKQEAPKQADPSQITPRHTAEWLHNEGKGRTAQETESAPAEHFQNIANHSVEINRHLNYLRSQQSPKQEENHRTHSVELSLSHPDWEKGEKRTGTASFGYYTTGGLSHNSEEVKKAAEERAKKAAEDRGYTVHSATHLGHKERSTQERIKDKLTNATEKLREAHEGMTPYDVNLDLSKRNEKPDLSADMWKADKEKKGSKPSKKPDDYYDKPNYGAYVHYKTGIHHEPIYVEAGDALEATEKVKKIVKRNPKNFDSSDVSDVTLYDSSKESPYKVVTGHYDGDKPRIQTRTIYHDNKTGAHRIAELMHIHQNSLKPSTVMMKTTSTKLPKEKKSNK